MPDPFTGIGLVGAILQFVETIVTVRDCIVDFQNAPKEQQDFLAEVISLRPLLDALKNRSANNSTSIQQFKEPLVRLEDMMKRLTKELPADLKAKAHKRWAWPLSGKKDIQEGMNTIERFKTLLGIWLAIDIWDVAQEEKKLRSDTAVDLKIAVSYVDDSVTANQKVLVKLFDGNTAQHKEERSALIHLFQNNAAQHKQDHSVTISSLNGLAEQQQQARG
ncbi:hypothetical protein B0H13DRAFT_1857303 [Mycena leptocephala]|nr:hypothetical protein B0H13DRAFT_1857303 [Mycena leptocephala]